MDRKLVISIEETDDYGYIVCFTTHCDGAVFTNKYVYKFDMVKHPANAVEIEGVIYSTGIQITSVDIIVLVMISIIFIIGYLLYNTIVQEDDTIATGLFMMCIIGGLGGLGLWLIGKFVYSDNEDETCKQGIEDESR